MKVFVVVETIIVSFGNVNDAISSQRKPFLLMVVINFWIKTQKPV